ncbi:hypothetical protein CF54_31250 [Streptomyces sp. Tu 6176]|uniref:hypothetical protein n=1 Tax=Streptomyces sp. Tu 6176 TaxID=1470557 RepID=UPI0004468DFB|nr:hypothetical protein [Streptomyces sp. Tu 6176]EYT79454.1 hypothetical protein CF54_31250 [Streptomyces sp. Tu 6176]
MVVVAVLLLPFVGGLLLIMDRIEDRVSAPAPARGRPARHRGHLRLVPGGRRTAGAVAARDEREEQEEREEQDAAAHAPGRDPGRRHAA